MLNLRNEQFKVGIYIRLSREDGDKQESESIGNQRNIIRRFLQDNDLNFVDEYGIFLLYIINFVWNNI